MPFTEYLKALRQNLRTGQAGEETHRPALQRLLHELGDDIQAINEPTQVPFGAPDFIIKRHDAPIGYIECKDLGANLNEVARSEQLTRYLDAFPNVILTDYLEFRWYREGELIEPIARVGRLTRDGTDIKRDSAGIAEVAELLTAFFTAEPLIAATATDLAQYLAAKARQLRRAAQGVLAREDEQGTLHALHEAFRETLIHDLDADQFADMYAQTLAYGLFSSCFELRRDQPGAEFTRWEAARYLPKTNPFLADLFYHITGRQLDHRVAWVVHDIADLLNRADMSQIAADFARQPGREDPVVHFYEDFLGAYDPAKRKARGVYYTPEPVVSYIVRSIDHLLKEKFDKPLGLADENVYILDPACGTGTFLYFVINQIKANIDEAGLAGTWSDYVKKHLLPRLFGFELLMAPYTIAHMKLAIQLQDLGYDFSGDERLGIYLTNTLEETVKVADTLMGFGLGLAIAEEANAAAEVKREKPIMVVLGNPPYSISSANRSEWILAQIEDYKRGLHEKKINIDDDYIKFIRFAQWRIDQTGYGIVGMITNNSYLDGITHRRMRQSLLDSFSDIYIYNLHGSTLRRDVCPDGSPDENVFDIRIGVTIALYAKRDNSDNTELSYSDLWGGRESSKYPTLAEKDASTTDWCPLSAQPPHFFFVPKDFARQEEYDRYVSIANLFPVHQSGLKTDRDRLFYDFDHKQLLDRIQTFFAHSYAPQFCETFRIYPSSSYDIEEARDSTEFSLSNIREAAYRPFDARYLYYDPALTSRPAFDVMFHMLSGKNMALISERLTYSLPTDTWAASWVCTSISDLHLIAGTSPVFPLYLYPEEGTTDEGRRPNLNPDFVKEFSQKLGLEFIPDGSGDLNKNFGPEDIFYYAYAVFHSPTYRERYAEFLKIDFPRLPLTSDRELFAALVEKGSRLADLHLLREKGQIGNPPAFNIEGSREVERVRYDDENQRVYINKTQYFAGVEPEVWEFQIGGYQVCQKWLKDRTIKKLGRPLNTDDIKHYRNIVLALRETIQIMLDIDRIIPSWPIDLACPP